MEVSENYTSHDSGTRTFSGFALFVKALLSLLLVFSFVQFSQAQSPCNAHRWQAGDAWQFNTGTNKWEAVTISQPSDQPKGVIRCASSAETESGLTAFKGAYNSATFAINSNLTNCFNQETEVRGTPVSGPTAGEDIVWFNFDIRPLAGTYQFQIITNQVVGWTLYYVDPAFAGPPATNTANGRYPQTPPGLSGFTGNCTTDLSRLVYADCGLSGNGWSTITVPSFTKPSNYYLAMWLADPGTGEGKSTFPGSMNLTFKARFGCGGSTCFLEPNGNPVLSCTQGGYTVCQTFDGSEGRWKITDNAAVKATSYSVTTYDQNGTVVENYTATSDANLYLELGTVGGSGTQTDVKATICATYATGQPFNISLTPSGTPSDAPSNYVACTSSGSFSGSGLTPPTANAGDDFTKTCTTNPNGKQIGEAPVAGFTYSWSPTTGLSDPNIANPVANPSTTTTYTVTKTNTATGCSDQDQVTVTVNNTAVVANAGDDFTKTCTTNPNGKQIGEAPVAGFTYSWSPTTGLSDPNIANPVANPSTTTTYTVTKTNTATGCSDQDQVTVTVNNTAVVANAGDDFTKTCTTNPNGKQIGEAPVAGFTYSWSPTTGLSDPNIANPVANPSTTTTYTVTKTNTATGCSDQDQVTVTVNNTAVVANAGDDFTKTCTTNPNGKQIGEAPVAGFTYSWSPTTGLSDPNIANPVANPSTTTTYTVTKTNTATGCSDQDQVTVTVNNTAVVANAGDDFTKTCTTNPNGKQIGEAPVAGFTYSWSPTTGLSDPNIANPVANPSTTTTYTVTKTNTATGCSDQDQVTVTVNNTAVVANAGDDFTKTCTTNPNGKQIGEAPVAGFTYSWSPTTGLSDPNIANPVANPSTTTTYTVTKTNTATGCSDQDQVTVTVNNTPPPTPTLSLTQPTCTVATGKIEITSSTSGLTFSLDGGGFAAYPAGGYTVNPGAHTVVAKNEAGCTSEAAPAQINAQPTLAKPTATATSPGCFQTKGSITITNFDASVTYTLLQGGNPTGISQVNGVFSNVPPGTYTVKGTKGSCEATSNAVTVNIPPVCTKICTYTQGFYGNKNGLALLPSLLTTPITIGRAGHSFIIPANTSSVPSAAKLNSIMPGGSTPAVLKSGDCSIMNSCLSQYLTSTGKINNVLLSQTITLTLNTRLKGSSLSSFPIKSGYIVTQGGCTKLNSSVVNYLTANGTKTATVSDLLNLANDVLGGVKTAGVNGVPSLSAINSAIDAINNIFDGCKNFIGYYSTCPYSTTITTSAQGFEEQPEVQKPLTVSTYPNPFSDKIRFVIESPVSGQANLDLYNMLGQKVHTVYHGHVTAGISQSVEYTVPAVSQGNLIYILNMNGKQVTGKLLNAKN